MKPQTILIIGGLIAAGGAAFYFWRKSQNSQVGIQAGPGTTTSQVNTGLLQQPSQVYPVTAQSVTRQDTASQSWYGGARPQDASASLIDQNLTANVQSLAALNSGVKSLTDIWQNLGVSNWFSEPDSSDDDIFGDLDWGSYNA